MRCPVCEKGSRVTADIAYDFGTEKIILKGERCTKCDEEFFDEKEFKRLHAFRQKLSQWGAPLKLHRKLSRSGRGTILRIPSDIEKSMGLSGTEHIRISKVGKRKLLVEID